MEAPINVAMLGSKDHMNIVKGKRTKRSRPQSPIPFAIACNNSMYNIEDNRGEVLQGIPISITNVEMKNSSRYSLPPSSSSSSSFEIYQDSNTTEEEEDMANCLILLAQGQPRESVKSHDVGITCNKFNSRKFMETSSNGMGKVGYYVYECKTCNRTFPSFQALGGHRASHKKPKTTALFDAAIVDEKNVKQLKATYEEEGPNYKNNNVRGLNGNNNNKVKVHECSICGAEFTSGQALGGHMRRHRGSIGGNVNVITTSTNLSLTVPMTIESEKPKKPINVLSLTLDLNLPAPEDDRCESEFAFSSKQHHEQQKQQQQQSSLIFSSPALVDCHY